MDEILGTPNHAPVRPASRSARRSGREQKNIAWSDRLHRFADAAAARSRRLKLQSARVITGPLRHGGEAKLGPLSFLALSLVIGLASVVGVVYTPAYVVSVYGVDLGLVQEPQVFEQVMDRVEARASNILGYDYTLQNQVGYERVLAEREDLSPISGFETYLFSQVGEVMKSYPHRGRPGSGRRHRPGPDRPDAGRDRRPYVNADTISVTYDKAVGVSLEYTHPESIKDISEMKAALTANTSGQTTYEVQKGDTFMALAFSNGMTMAEMEALNPGVDINKLQDRPAPQHQGGGPLSVRADRGFHYLHRGDPCTVRRLRTTPCTRASPRSWTPASPVRLCLRQRDLRQRP
ncbi:MAG: LysM peptidoglycan-binding domain-containing protein [Dysosmobacter welbionis]